MKDKQHLKEFSSQSNLQNNTSIKRLAEIEKLLLQATALLKPRNDQETKALEKIKSLITAANSTAKQAVASVQGGIDPQKIIDKVKKNQLEKDVKDGNNITMPAPPSGAKTVTSSSQNESKNKQKDYEYDMARNQLETAKRSIEQLLLIMGKKKEGDLEAWVQSKLTLAVDYLNTVANYMTSDKRSLKEMVSGAGGSAMGSATNTAMKKNFGKEKNTKNEYIKRSPEDEEKNAAEQILDEEEQEDKAEKYLREEIKESIAKLYKTNKQQFRRFYEKALFEANNKNKDKTYYLQYKLPNTDPTGFNFAVQTILEIGKKIEERSQLVINNPEDYQVFVKGLLENVKQLCNQIEQNMSSGAEVAEPVVRGTQSTGTSTLVGLFTEIRGAIEGYYRDLQTSPDQRESYKNNLVNILEKELMKKQPQQQQTEELEEQPEDAEGLYGNEEAQQQFPVQQGLNKKNNTISI